MLQCIMLHSTLRRSMSDFQILSLTIRSDIQDLKLCQSAPREFAAEEKTLNSMYIVSITSTIEWKSYVEKVLWFLCLLLEYPGFGFILRLELSFYHHRSQNLLFKFLAIAIATASLFAIFLAVNGYILSMIELITMLCLHACL